MRIEPIINHELYLIDGEEVEITHMETKSVNYPHEGAEIINGEVVSRSRDCWYEDVVSIRTNPDLPKEQKKKLIEFINEHI